MLKRCLLISSIGLALSSGLTQAGLNAKKVSSYGLYVSNWGMTLVVQPHKGDVSMYSATTLSNPELLGDPPTFGNNDSPVNFLSIMLKPEIADALRQQNEQFGDNVERQLYIAAAGYDGVKGQLLSQKVTKKINNEPVEKPLREWIQGSIASSRANTVLGVSVNDALTDAGCYDEETKADFHHCALRWVLKHRTGIDIKPESSVVEQDNELMAQMAMDLRDERQLQPNQHILLQATTLLQPYALDQHGLQQTPGWMGNDSPWWDPEVLTRSGGPFKTGYYYGTSQTDGTKATTVLNLLVEAKLQLRVDAGETFYGGKTQKNAATVAENLRGFRYNTNAGAMIFDIADSGDKAHKPKDITDEQYATAQEEALRLMRMSQDEGVLSAILFLGLMQPSITEGSYILVVGEVSRLFTGLGDRDLYTTLGEWGAKSSKIDRSFDTYQKLLTAEKFTAFDAIQAGKRKPDQLRHGMDKTAFKHWLRSLQELVQDKVLYIPEDEYATALMNACRSRYTGQQ